MFNKEKIQKLENRVCELESLLLVDNYFKGCPCCPGSEKIPKSEAVVFKKLCIGWINNSVWEFYTTKESIKAHNPIIKEWEQEIEIENKKSKK